MDIAGRRLSLIGCFFPQRCEAAHLTNELYRLAIHCAVFTRQHRKSKRLVRHENYLAVPVDILRLGVIVNYNTTTAAHADTSEKIMNSSIPAFRLGLFALTGAMILGTVSLQARRENASSFSETTPIATQAAKGAAATVTLPTISVRPSAEEMAAAYAPAEAAIPTLATIPVHPSEEEVIAANIDPTDRIQIFATMTVRPDAETLATLLQPQPLAVADGDDESNGSFGAVFADAVVRQHHRLRLDMPYYSFGNVLAQTRAK
jgi:hypothetical protein